MKLRNGGEFKGMGDKGEEWEGYGWDNTTADGRDNGKAKGIKRTL